MGLGRIRNPRVFCDRRRKSFQKSRSIFSPSQPNFTGIKAIIGVTSPFHSKLFRRESPESAKLVSSYYQARGKRCQKRVVGLEDLFERPQISLQTRMPNLMERKSTRRVENAAAQPTSVRERVRQWATNPASETSRQTVCVGDIPVPSRARRGLEARSRERCGA
jgi:hypothetical protein